MNPNAFACKQDKKDQMVFRDAAMMAVVPSLNLCQLLQ
jgi:hypothetical protein